MSNESIAKLIKEFKSLSISERERFIDFITVNYAPSDFKTVIDTKLAEGSKIGDIGSGKREFFMTLPLYH